MVSDVSLQYSMANYLAIGLTGGSASLRVAEFQKIIVRKKSKVWSNIC